MLPDHKPTSEQEFLMPVAFSQCVLEVRACITTTVKATQLGLGLPYTSVTADDEFPDYRYWCIERKGIGLPVSSISSLNWADFPPPEYVSVSVSVRERCSAVIVTLYGTTHTDISRSLCEAIGQTAERTARSIGQPRPDSSSSSDAADTPERELSKPKQALPVYGAHRRRYQGIWMLIKGQAKQGKSYTAMHRWLKATHPDLVREHRCSSLKVLAKIVKLGLSGQLNEN